MSSGQSRSNETGGAALDDMVWLVPRDPDWALAIWQLGADAVGAARSRLAAPLGDSALQLRVYPVGGGMGRRRPVQVYRIRRWIGQRLVLLPRQGRPHQAAVGFVDAAGAFVPAVRSEVIVPPVGGYRAARAEAAAEGDRRDGGERDMPPEDVAP